jgi:hypothetical protein
MTQTNCMFCNHILGLSSGWVKCSKGNKPCLLKTAKHDPREVTSRDQSGLWWRESLVDLIVSRPCYKEDK